MGGVRGHAEIGFLGPVLDLGEDRVGQLIQIRRLGLGVGILRLEVAQDVRIFLVPQPLVRVIEDVPMVDPTVNSAVGDRRLDFGRHIGGHGRQRNPAA